ncbi:DUF4236 domain-containing protein [Croceicoccus sp. F390]|uniref:DUF4236 domain-containing protein n=1 Tax=Croceicoccus esteveae TaxID=3075597 RepID=A0ABU2ZE11_9SPHN|nr:DUF4236 domain-containing protein [Croceicoccus sp. F390]MDT0574837.1 DUF4236 domain-containing protein [Croceicoccus sp. F390]
MGFRFHKSIRLLPGVRLNLSKSGVSTTFGVRGANVNVGKRGIRRTIGLPGTGISHTAVLSSETKGLKQGPFDSDQVQRRPNSRYGCLALLIVAILLIWLSSCNSELPHDPNLAPASGAASNFTNGQTAYVTASRLNMRDGPSKADSVMGQLPIGSQVRILDRSSEWLKVAHNGAMLWISAEHVSETGPDHEVPASRLPVIATEQQSRAETSGGLFWGKSCKKGKPCGNACIARDRVCHK